MISDNLDPQWNNTVRIHAQLLPYEVLLKDALVVHTQEKLQTPQFL